jgi:hypothetical protein
VFTSQRLFTMHEFEAIGAARSDDPTLARAADALLVANAWRTRDALPLIGRTTLAGAAVELVRALASHPGMRVTRNGPVLQSQFPRLNTLFNTLLHDGELAAGVMSAQKGDAPAARSPEEFVEQMRAGRAALDAVFDERHTDAMPYLKARVRRQTGRFFYLALGQVLEAVRGPETRSPRELTLDAMDDLRDSVQVLAEAEESFDDSVWARQAVITFRTDVLDKLSQLPWSVNERGDLHLELGDPEDQAFANMFMSFDNMQSELRRDRQNLSENADHRFWVEGRVSVRPAPLALATKDLDLGAFATDQPPIDLSAYVFQERNESVVRDIERANLVEGYLN